MELVTLGITITDRVPGSLDTYKLGLVHHGSYNILGAPNALVKRSSM